MPWTHNKRGRGYHKTGQKRGGNVARPRQYEALRKAGYSKSRAAAITNASAYHPKRTARRAVASRKRHGRARARR